MTDTTALNISTLVQHTRSLEKSVFKSLTHPHYWNRYDLTRFYEKMLLTQEEQFNVAAFVTPFVISIVLIHLHQAFVERQKHKKTGLDWDMNLFFLTHAMNQIRRESTHTTTKQIEILLELYQVMLLVKIPETLKVHILAISQHYESTYGQSMETDVLQILPLYERYITSFYPQLAGTVELFSASVESLTFIVRPFCILLTNQATPPLDLEQTEKIPGCQEPSWETGRYFSSGTRGWVLN